MGGGTDCVLGGEFTYGVQTLFSWQLCLKHMSQLNQPYQFNQPTNQIVFTCLSGPLDLPHTRTHVTHGAGSVMFQDVSSNPVSLPSTWRKEK